MECFQVRNWTAQGTAWKRDNRLFLQISRGSVIVDTCALHIFGLNHCVTFFSSFFYNRHCFPVIATECFHVRLILLVSSSSILYFTSSFSWNRKSRSVHFYCKCFQIAIFFAHYKISTESSVMVVKKKRSRVVYDESGHSVVNNNNIDYNNNNNSEEMKDQGEAN